MEHVHQVTDKKYPTCTANNKLMTQDLQGLVDALLQRLDTVEDTVEQISSNTEEMWTKLDYCRGSFVFEKVHFTQRRTHK
jgi:hypothetical protein